LSDDGEFQVEVARDRGKNDIVELSEFSRSIPLKVLETGKSVCFVDSGGQSKGTPTDSFQRLALRAVMCAPLQIRDRILGVMYVDSQAPKRELDEADERFFEAVTQQMAVTLENARLTQEMIDAERLTALGEATSMILHDLANPLSAVQGYAEMLQARDLPPAQIKEIAGTVEDSVHKIQTMLRSILEFSRGQTSTRLEPVPIGPFLQEICDRLKHEIDWHDVACALDIDCDRIVQLDRGRMERVFTNLAVNALQVMPDGGTFSVVARPTDKGEVRIVLSDTGPGIPKEIRSHVFEPFVTHGKKRGTGLGLAIVKRTVEAHGGQVEVNTWEGQGTAFVLTLPAKKTG
jgi:signal transduction histidine kinase